MVNHAISQTFHCHRTSISCDEQKVARMSMKKSVSSPEDEAEVKFS
jgi:hypothetical protein